MPFRPPTSSSIVPPRCTPLRRPLEPVTTVAVKELVRHTGAGRGTWDALEDAPLSEAPMGGSHGGFHGGFQSSPWRPCLLVMAKTK